MVDDSVIERLRDAIGDRECFGAVSDARIVAAEESLGVRFPSSYRAFLGAFGAAWLCPPLEIAGLPDEPKSDESPLWTDVVAVTQRIREVSRGNTPSSYVWIADDGSDYSFYLDTASIDPSGECCVRILGPGRDGVIVAASFLEFVELVADEGIEAVAK